MQLSVEQLKKGVAMFPYFVGVLGGKEYKVNKIEGEYVIAQKFYLFLNFHW